MANGGNNGDTVLVSEGGDGVAWEGSQRNQRDDGVVDMVVFFNLWKCRLRRSGEAQYMYT